MSEHETSPHHDERTELEKLLLNSKPWFQENGTVLIYAMAAFMAIAAIYVYVNRTPPANVEASRDLLLARTPEEYRDVADAYPDTAIGTWAKLRQAERLLDDAVTNMFTNRPEGKSLLEQSDTAFQVLIERSGLDDQVRERVLIGLARIAETKSDGSEEATKTAVDAWQRILNEYEKTIVKEHAEARVKELSTDKSKAFYAWFQAQNPTPADPGLAPGQPNVPDVPDLDSMGLTIPGVQTPESVTGEEKPAEGSEGKTEEAKPADEKPATPAAETPAEPVKVEEAKPEAAAKPAEPTAEPAKETPAAEPKVETPATEAPAAEAPATEPQADAAAGDSPK